MGQLVGKLVRWLAAGSSALPARLPSCDSTSSTSTGIDHRKIQFSLKVLLYPKKEATKVDFGGVRGECP